jgi:peptide/nickel transport system permease protein
MVSATIVSLMVALAAGIYAALRQYSTLDYLVTVGTFFGTAMPVFWLGSMLLLLSFTFRDWG